MLLDAINQQMCILEKTNYNSNKCLESRTSNNIFDIVKHKIQNTDIIMKILPKLHDFYKTLITRTLIIKSSKIQQIYYRNSKNEFRKHTC
jgi:hypothetical protein